MSATCTSGEPVSPFWVAFSVITVFLRSGVTAISTPKVQSSYEEDTNNPCVALQAKPLVPRMLQLPVLSTLEDPSPWAMLVLFREPGSPRGRLGLEAVRGPWFVRDAGDGLAGFEHGGR